MLGALGFGWLTDRIGRKKLFFITLALYLSATAATALSWGVASYALFRFLTGAGIGGEYTAINSTIQELVPARYRGWTDLLINGSFWIGAAIGATSAIILLDPAVIGPDHGWRLAYLTGACLGLIVLVMRMWIPESPRWLMIHGHPEQADAIVGEIEKSVTGHVQAASALPKIKIRMRDHTPLGEVARHAIHDLSPAFAGRVGADGGAGVFLQCDLLHLRAGADRFLPHPGRSCRLVSAAVRGRQFPGPLLLGRLFDTLGRRVMITFTYGVSGVLLALSGYLFSIGALSAQGQTIAWMVIFFFASPAASAAYLTVSENFRWRFARWRSRCSMRSAPRSAASPGRLCSAC